MGADFGDSRTDLGMNPRVSRSGGAIWTGLKDSNIIKAGFYDCTIRTGSGNSGGNGAGSARTSAIGAGLRRLGMIGEGCSSIRAGSEISGEICVRTGNSGEIWTGTQNLGTTSTGSRNYGTNFGMIGLGIWNSERYVMDNVLDEVLGRRHQSLKMPLFTGEEPDDWIFGAE